MLQVIREHAQSWIFKIIIAFIVISFTFWGISGYFIGSSENSTVATVNGVKITKEQLAVSYERLRRQIQIQYGSSRTITPKDETAIKLRALQALVEAEALKQASTHQGFLLSDRQVDNYIESVPDFQVDGRFSEKRFHQVLSATLLSTSDFYELIRNSMLIDQLRLGVLATSFSLSSETKDIMGLVNQERDFDYLTIPMDAFIKTPIVITDQEALNYYNQHKQAYKTNEQVSVDYVALSMNDLINRLKPDDAALRAYYNDNINAYMMPKQLLVQGFAVPLSEDASKADQDAAINKAKSLLASISQSKERLQEIMKQYPLQPVANEMQAINKFPEPWQKSLAQLKQDEWSQPILSKNNVVILKVIQVKDAAVQDFTTVKDSVLKAYARQRAEEQFSVIRDQLSELAYQHPESLKTIEEKLGLPIQTSVAFTKDGPGAGIFENKKLRDVAFSDDVLVSNNNSDVVNVNADTALVMRVKTHTKASLLPFESVSKQIKDKLRSEKTVLAAKQAVEQVIKQLRTHALSMQQVATQYRQLWVSAGYQGRYSAKVGSAELDVAFQLPHPTSATAPNFGSARLRDAYAIVALKDVRNGAAKDKNDLTVFAEQVQNSMGLLEYELLKQSIIQNSEIVISK